MVMGWALLEVYAQAPAYTMALSAGFLLMGPFLCLGLYRVSQRLENGEQPDFGDSLMAWDTRTGQLAIFGFVLLVLEMLWGRATLVVFAVSFDGMPDLKGSLLALLEPRTCPSSPPGSRWGDLRLAHLCRERGLHPHDPAPPDRRRDRRPDQPAPGAHADRRHGLVGPDHRGAGGTGAAPWFAGLLLVGPVIGHASWHAYRAAVAD